MSPRALTGPGFIRLFHGVYVANGVPCTIAVRARAALLLAPQGSLVSHHTAARLWGGIVPEAAGIDLAIPHAHRMDVDGVRAHRFRTLPTPRLHRGLRVVEPATIFVQLAERLDLVDLVVLGDSLVRRGSVTPEQLRTAAIGGPRHVVRAAGLVRADVESGPETRLRLLLVLAGLPEPVVDYRVRDEEGHVVYRVDLAYRIRTPRGLVKVAIEYDGRHHENPTRRSPDLIRREDLEDGGWVFAVVVADDLFQHPGRTLHRIVRVATRSGVRMPRQLDERWRRHFPDRD